MKAYPEEIEKDARTRIGMSDTVFALSHVLAGTGRIHYAREHRTVAVKAGDFFIFNNHRLSEVVFDVEPGFFECSAAVDGDTGSHLAALHIWDLNMLSIPASPNRVVVEAYYCLYQAIASLKNDTRQLLRQFIQLIELVAGLADSRDPNRRFREEACALLSSHCEPGYRICDAAEAMGMSYEAFRQRFHKVFGMPPQEFQMRIRMERASVMLRYDSVKETALKLGYRDPFVFSRQFKERMGLPPREYGKHATARAE